MIILSKEQVIKLHENIIKETGGSFGLRDDGLLDSALNAPFQSYAGNDIYPSLYQKAARLGYGLVCNHPFLDGNKRIGAHAMLVFLYLNKEQLSYTQRELSDIFLSIASGESGYDQLLKWLLEHSQQ